MRIGDIMLTCHGEFAPFEIWFLRDSSSLHSRRMEKGICPVCEKNVVMTFGKYINDGSLETKRYVKRKALIMYEQCKQELNYKYTGITRSGTLLNSTFYYGVNKEIRKNGTTYIRQRAINLNDKGTIIQETRI